MNKTITSNDNKMKRASKLLKLKLMMKKKIIKMKMDFSLIKEIMKPILSEFLSPIGKRRKLRKLKKIIEMKSMKIIM